MLHLKDVATLKRFEFKKEGKIVKEELQGPEKKLLVVEDDEK